MRRAVRAAAHRHLPIRSFTHRPLRVRDGITGRVAQDSLHSVGEPAPVGDQVEHAIGHLEARVKVCDHVCWAVGSDNATQSGAISEMRPPIGVPILETPGKRGGRPFSGQWPDLS